MHDDGIRALKVWMEDSRWRYPQLHAGCDFYQYSKSRGIGEVGHPVQIMMHR